MRMARVVVVPGVAVLALAVGACTGGPAATPGRAPAAPAAADATRVWGEFVACARQNGYPAWPDAIVDPTGTATFQPVAGFDPKEALEAVRQPCGELLNRLPAQANPLSRPVVPPDMIAKKLAYSRCMRENGVPEWNDPGPDGYYTDHGIPGYNTDEAVTTRVNAARDKCDPILGG
jgi:hypothetical protein